MPLGLECQVRSSCSAKESVSKCSLGFRHFTSMPLLIYHLFIQMYTEKQMEHTATFSKSPQQVISKIVTTWMLGCSISHWEVFTCSFLLALQGAVGFLIDCVKHCMILLYFDVVLHSFESAIVTGQSPTCCG